MIANGDKFMKATMISGVAVEAMHIVLSLKNARGMDTHSSSWRYERPRHKWEEHQASRDGSEASIPVSQWPADAFVQKFVIPDLDTCIEKWIESNRGNDRLRRCDQCGDVARQKGHGTPVVLCKACWSKVEATRDDLCRDYLRINDAFYFSDRK